MAAIDRAEQRKAVLARIGEALHDLCQPLTALQCRLEIAQMNLETDEAADPGSSVTTAGASSAVLAECLRECARLNGSVNTMRSLVRQARADEQESNE